MDTKPLFVANLTLLKKPVIELTLPTPDLGVFVLKSDIQKACQAELQAGEAVGLK